MLSIQWDTTGWSVCVSLAGVAAHGLELWFGYQGNVLQNKPANFDDAGVFYESVHYTDYAVSEYLLFRLALSGGRLFHAHALSGFVVVFHRQLR